MAIKIQKTAEKVKETEEKVEEFHPDDKIPLFWDIQETPEGYRCVNCRTGRVYEGSREGFRKFFK